MMTTATPSRWLDSTGHAWPISGHWCAICGLPLTRVEPTQVAHPNCVDFDVDNNLEGGAPW